MQGLTQRSVGELSFYTSHSRFLLLSVSRSFTSELDDFIRDIANANDGVANALTSIDRGLTGNDGIADQGLLDNWHNAAYSRLADKSNVNYTVESYIQEMDNRLQTMLQLYRNGLVLLTLTTQGEKLGSLHTLEQM